MRYLLFLLAVATASALAAPADKLPARKAPSKKLLLIGQGPDGHPARTHEYLAGLRVLTALLEPLGTVETTTVRTPLSPPIQPAADPIASTMAAPRQAATIDTAARAPARMRLTVATRPPFSRGNGGGRLCRDRGGRRAQHDTHDCPPGP